MPGLRAASIAPPLARTPMYPIKLPLQRAVKRDSVLHKQLLNALDTHRIGVCREGTLHVPAKPMTASLGDRAAGTRARALPVLPVHRMCGGTFAAPGRCLLP